MKIFKIISFSIVLLISSFGCHQTNNRELLLEKELELTKRELALEKEKQNIAYLRDSIKADKNVVSIYNKDSAQQVKTETNPTPEKTSIKKEEPKKKEKEIKQSPKALLEEKNESLSYYFNTKQLSVKINPWDNGRQKIELYDKQGNKTFELENIKHSFHQTNQLSFHQNGALQSTFIHLNPGASRYWYETTIQFDENNNPLNKVSKQMPSESILEAMGKTYLWNTQKKDWILQETMQCQPVNTK